MVGMFCQKAGYAFGRYARLPLTSKLDALCAAYVNRHSFAPKAHGTDSNRGLPHQNKNPDHKDRDFVLEVQAGFEPADNGVADRGLTTWLLHQTFNCLNIITEVLPFVKCFFSFILCFFILFAIKNAFAIVKIVFIC